MTAVGFEPTPLRTGALSQRLRQLGQTVLRCNAIDNYYQCSRDVLILHFARTRNREHGAETKREASIPSLGVIVAFEINRHTTTNGGMEYDDMGASAKCRNSQTKGNCLR